MGHYNPAAYAELHEGVKVLQADLKTAEGQDALHRELARTDVCSLRSALRIPEAGAGLEGIAQPLPVLSQVAIVGAPARGRRSRDTT